MHHPNRECARAYGGVADRDRVKKLIEEWRSSGDVWREPFVCMSLRIGRLKIGITFGQSKKTSKIVDRNFRGVCTQVVQQRLLAHVMDNDARGIIGAAGVSAVLGQKIFEHF